MFYAELSHFLQAVERLKKLSKNIVHFNVKYYNSLRTYLGIFIRIKEGKSIAILKGNKSLYGNYCLVQIKKKYF